MKLIGEVWLTRGADDCAGVDIYPGERPWLDRAGYYHAQDDSTEEWWVDIDTWKKTFGTVGIEPEQCRRVRITIEEMEE